MTTIYETTDRLIGEHVDELLALAWDIDEQPRPMSAEADERGHRPTMPFVRLIAAVHLLYQQHGVDAKGRCHICAERTRVWCTRTRPCTVYAALSFFLTQPDELVLHDIPRPPPTQQSPPVTDLQRTVELPRIRDC